MNREDVIRMAREAGWSGLYVTWAEPDGKPDWSPYKESLTVPVTIEQIESFADLVAEAERKRCLDACRPYEGDHYVNKIMDEIEGCSTPSNPG